MCSHPLVLGARADAILHHDRPVAPAPDPGSQERDHRPPHHALGPRRVGQRLQGHPRGPLAQLIGVLLLSHDSDPSVSSLPPSNPGRFTPFSTGHRLTAMPMASHPSEVRTWLSHRIPHDFLGTAVQDGSEIDEPGPRTDVGDIPAPLTPRLVDGGSAAPPGRGAHRDPRPAR